jgi:hypothetical protein
MRLGRKFLQHPLSNLDDSRFVVSVDLQSARGTSRPFSDINSDTDGSEIIFRPFDLTPLSERPDVDEKVVSVRNRIQGLHDFWFEYYREFVLRGEAEG